MDEHVALTKQLINIPSVSGDEAAILAFVADWMRQQHFDDVITRPDFTAGVVRAAKQPAKRALILCGHIDTVAPGDEAAWSRSPWQAEVVDGRLYGLGATDMKAGVALQMITARDVLTDRREGMDIWCVTVAHEEVDGAGSAAFTAYFAEATSYEEVNCLIAEPTDSQRIEVGHRGNCFIQLDFAGHAGHASQEEAYAASALPKLVHFLNELPTIRQDMHQRYQHEVLGRPSLTPTCISPSESVSANKTADHTYLALDIRTTPGLDEELTGYLDELAQRYDATWRFMAEPVNAALCSETAPILRAVRQAVPGAHVAVSLGATDQAFFQNIGVETVIYGPGEFGLAHTTDESVSLDAMNDALAVYRRLVASL